jgi:3'-5' exoribonuclease
MSRPAARMPIVPLHELTPGQQSDSFALLQECAKGLTREGKPYYACRFADKQRTVAYMVWADTPWFKVCEAEWRQGQVYKLRLTYIEHEKYGPQLELHNIRPTTDADLADGFDPSQFVDQSRFDPEAMFHELVMLAEKEIVSDPLRKLTKGLLQKWAKPIKELPASENRFHPFRGGWLEHTLSVTKACMLLVEHYQRHYADAPVSLNRDLILCGAILHNIGRVKEMRTTGPVTPPQPTVPGKLLGHLILGRDLVRETALAQGDVPLDLLERLEHLVLSYLALPEWGSPRLPMLPEVILLHHAVDLDAKLEMYLRALRRDTTPGPFTVREPMLNKQLLKPGPWEAERVE